MSQNLTLLCRAECLRLLRELPHSTQAPLILHTLKANVHALGLTQLARQIHAAEEAHMPSSHLPVAQWRSEIERLHPLERSWEELLMRLAQENKKTLDLHWQGPHLDELTSIVLHLARNTIAHAQKDQLSLWVTVKQRGNSWHVQIRDDAGGIQAHQREVDLLAGRGAGLQYVQDTLKAWGGTCGILSNPGHGVTVTLVFPALDQNVA
jgi:signal transduction histidine kinase